MVMRQARQLIQHHTARQINGMQALLSHERFYIAVDSRDSQSRRLLLRQLENLLNRQRSLSVLKNCDYRLSLLRVSFHIFNFLTPN
jgi:hypothetical protein